MKTLLSFRPIYKAKYHAIDPNLQLLLISFREHTYMMSDFRRGGVKQNRTWGLDRGRWLIKYRTSHYSAIFPIFFFKFYFFPIKRA